MIGQSCSTKSRRASMKMAWNNTGTGCHRLIKVILMFTVYLKEISTP